MCILTNAASRRSKRIAALLALAIVAAAAPAQQSTKTTRSSSKAQSTKVVHKSAQTTTNSARYETIRISKPDGSVVTLRVPRRHPLSKVVRPATYRSATRHHRVGNPLAESERTPDTPLPRLHSPDGITISHPTLGRYPLTIDDNLANTLRLGTTPARLGDNAEVAGDDPTEWRNGRGWAPGSENDEGGHFLDTEGQTEFKVLVPGAGFGGPEAPRDAIGLPDDDGYDAQAIARWNCVPHQEVNEDFVVGVVAFHKRGIKYVMFSLDGGTDKQVDQPQFNERTGTWEYAVTLRPSITPRDGEVEIRAIVYPNVGEPRILAGPLDGSMAFQNGEHSMFLTTNTHGSLKNPVYYCSPDGDDATGDGTEDNPFKVPSRALRQATLDHGSADGATCYLLPGNYPWGPKPWPLIVTSDRWPIITPAPGVSRDQVIIDEGPVGGFSTSLICARNVTITGDMTVRGGGEVWLDNVRAIGPGPNGPYNSLLFQGRTDFLAEYITNSEISDYRNGAREATLTRGSNVHSLWGVPFGQTGLIVNCESSNINEMGTGSHGDILRWLLDSNELENFITYGLRVTDADVQGIFAEVQGESNTLNDIAIVNVHISKDSDSANGSWWEPNTNHLLLWHVSLPDQPFRWAQDDYNTSVRNVSIIGSIFKAFTHTPLPINDPEISYVNHIHYVNPNFYGSFFVGFDRSFGSASFEDPANGNYELLPESTLHGRIPYQNRVVLNDVAERTRAENTAIGPFATDELPPE